MTAPWGAGALHQRLNAFVKKSLIQQLVPPNAVVCDLYCGRGVDTENWDEAKIGKYVGVDLSSSALEEAREEWERNEKPFVARFCELNPCMADLEKHLGVDRLSVDVVTCLSHLQDCFASEDMVRQLLKNVASLLKPGGYFFGATPDSSTIWYKYQKAVEGAMKAGSLRANGHLPRVRTELYSISFEDDRFNEYGSRYQLRFADESVPPQSQILVHFPSLIRRAEELGLECVEIQNLTEFYEDYRVPFAESLQKNCGTLVDAKGHPVVDGKSRLSPVAQDVLSLYTTFIFKKPDPQQRERSLKRPPVDAKKSKKFSPAVHIPAPEDRLPKKQRLSASPAVVTSNGSKMQDPAPKQEKLSKKPDPVPTARPTLKPAKPEEPKPQEKDFKKVGAQSPSATKAEPSEEVKVEGSQPGKITLQGTDTTKPLVSENKAPEPVKRKRVSRWSSEYVPKAISAQIKGEGVTSQQLRDHGKHNLNHQPLPKQEPPEEGEVGADDPIRSPKREKHGAQNVETSSETVPGRNTHFNGAVAPEKAAATDSQSERARGEALAPDPPAPSGPDVKKENPRPRKKEIAMDVLLDRQSTDTSTEASELAPDMDLERASKLSRDSPSGEAPFSDRFGSWETKPQRYTLRRAASLSEGGVESPWPRGGGRAPFLRAPGAAPGLLGAAPDSRRFEGFTRPGLRGNLFKSDPGDGGPWEEQFQDDARSRVNR